MKVTGNYFGASTGLFAYVVTATSQLCDELTASLCSLLDRLWSPVTVGFDGTCAYLTVTPTHLYASLGLEVFVCYQDIC